MYRCALPAMSAVIATAALSFSFGAHAQTHRHFTAQTLRGELQVVQSPDVLLNGSSARLSPGARIFGDNNLLQLPASLTGQTLKVHYTFDMQGLIREVWVLNSVELANKPWPTTAAEAASWTFNAATQTWTKS